MAKHRKRYTDDFKQNVINQCINLKNGESVTAIANKFNLERTLIYRWMREGSIPQPEPTPGMALSQAAPSASPSSRSKEDPRDQIIYQLKHLVADLNLKIIDLEARLGGNRRYSDRRLFSSNHPSDSA